MYQQCNNSDNENIKRSIRWKKYTGRHKNTKAGLNYLPVKYDTIRTFKHLYQNFHKEIFALFNGKKYCIPK